MSIDIAQISSAVALAPVAVLILTDLAKAIPVKFTSAHPAWVNGILSFIAAIIAVKPDITSLTSLAVWISTILYIAVVAAIAYNQWTSHLTKPTTPTV